MEFPPRQKPASFNLDGVLEATQGWFRQRHALSRSEVVSRINPVGRARHTLPGLPFIMLQGKPQTIKIGGYNLWHLKNTNREQLFPA